MAPTAQTTHFPVAVYLNTSWDPDAEYVNGVIEERPNRGAFQMVGFPTEQSARVWLDGFLQEVRAARVAQTKDLAGRNDPRMA